MDTHPTTERGFYCAGCGHLNPPEASHCEQCLTPLVSSHELWRAQSLVTTATTVSYAGFWKRVAAYIIDVFVLAVIGGIVGACYALALIAQGVEDGSLLNCVATLSGIVIGWVYRAAMESSPKQGTLGKLALGIKVTDLDGERISFGRATGRFFGSYISSLLLWVGYFMVAFTEKKQALHDMMAGCLVVDR
jgi:uncharacterized RDD family membrane protein YckC